MTKIFNLVIKRWVLSATSHADSKGGFKDFYGESFRKPRHDRSHPKQPGCTAYQMRFCFRCVNRSSLVRYVQCAERMRKRGFRGL